MDKHKNFSKREPSARNLSPKPEARTLLRSKTFHNDSDAKIFRMQEPVSKNILSKKEQQKEVIQEKEVLIQNNLARIEELEKEVEELKETNQSLERQLHFRPSDENEFKDIMIDYDNFFKKIWKEREEYMRQKNLLETYTKNLEYSYNHLLEKFEKAKQVIYNMKTNQDLLVEDLEECKQMVEMWEDRYDNLKEHSENTIAEANNELGAKEKFNLEQIAKLKTKIVNRQAKIIELEKMVKPSIYAPLRNKISSK